MTHPTNQGDDHGGLLKFQPHQTRQVLQRFAIRPKKQLGQNFITDAGAIERIIDCAQVSSADEVLEIGAGVGTLTQALAMRAETVVAVEYDPRLIAVLEWCLEGYANVCILQGDILNIELSDHLHKDTYVVVANIPYYLTSALIRKLMEAPNRADRLTLTVQREVAERVIAQAGSMNLLALGVQVYGKPEICGRIPARSFYPAPKVDSAILRVSAFLQPRIPPALLPAFFTLARAGFAQKRKQLKNSLAHGLHLEPQMAERILEQARIQPTRRAQELDIEEWRILAESYEREVVKD